MSKEKRTRPIWVVISTADGQPLNKFDLRAFDLLSASHVASIVKTLKDAVRRVDAREDVVIDVVGRPTNLFGRSKRDIMRNR